MNRRQRGGGLIEVLTAQTIFSVTVLALLALQLGQQRDAQRIDVDYAALQHLANAMERLSLPAERLRAPIDAEIGGAPRFDVDHAAVDSGAKPLDQRHRIVVSWTDRDGVHRHALTLTPAHFLPLPTR